MAMQNILDVVIKLRRDTEDNFNAVKDNFVPHKGEPVLVETKNNGLRIKIGDGVTVYGALAYVDDLLIRGYYLNDKFYYDTTYTTVLPMMSNKLYVNIQDNMLYTCNGVKYAPVADVATEQLAGIMKLYGYEGYNTDGTITQKFFTESVEKIKLSVDADDGECLVLDKPWW